MCEETENRRQKVFQTEGDTTIDVVSPTIHMIRCSLGTARCGVVRNDQQMVVEALDEIDSLVAKLDRRVG
jgi:hypothetical protein